MKKRFSRRDFMVTGPVALGALAFYELTGLPGGKTVHGARAVAAEGTQEKSMPHVSVKLWPGRSEEDKQRLADAIAKDVVRYTGCSESAVSVSIEEVPSGEWKEKVYDPYVKDEADLLYKKPGYSM